eukprot:370211_1
MNLCFYLSYFLTTPNESIFKDELQNYILPLQQLIEPNIAKLITSFIVQQSNYLKWIQFEHMENEKFHSYQNQVVYSHNDNIVDFSNDRNDYVNVRTSLLSPNIFTKYFINIYCFDKGDEMWLGLDTCKYYKPTESRRIKKYTLLYYGGRERYINDYGDSDSVKCSQWGSHGNDCNHGSIQGGMKGDVIKHPLPVYRAGDWISFAIDVKNKIMIVFKNGKKIYRVPSKYFPHGDCCFTVHVDTDRDKFYIEQAINFNNGMYENVNDMEEEEIENDNEFVHLPTDDPISDNDDMDHWENAIRSLNLVEQNDDSSDTDESDS